MKKNVITIFALVGTLLLTSCDHTVDPKKDRVIAMDAVTVTNDGKGVSRTPNGMKIFFKGGSDIPYYSVKDTADFLQTMRQSKLGNSTYIKYSVQDNKAVMTNDNNDVVTFDLASQKIIFSDFDSFDNLVTPAKDTLAVIARNTVPVINSDDTTYTKGKEYVVDLNAYSKLDIYKSGDEYYIPFTVFNDLFINPHTFFNAIYDFDSVFFLPNGVKFVATDMFGQQHFTPIGEAFYKNAKENPQVSKEYAEYYYQTICLNFDYLYGVKGIHGRDYTSFDSYLTTHGYKDDLLSGDVHKMDNAYQTMLTYLDDMHTATTGTSPLYEYGGSTIDKTNLNPVQVQEIEEGETLNAARRFTHTEQGFSFDRKNGVAYITFNEFDVIDSEELKSQRWTIDDVLGNSAILFSYAHQQITDNYLEDTRYVVVDLATNDGGSSDSLIYILGLLVGDFAIETQNPYTGATTKTNYKVDINLDGKFDEKDVSLREHGLKIVFVTNKHSFSCGNALPVFAEYAYPDDVTILGETSGGGTCIVRESFTALGTPYSLSGLSMLSKRDLDNKLVSIEDGVDPDIELDRKFTIDKARVLAALLNE